ncbi:MAG: protoporphyrinogen oxidase HemJ [Mariprofundales bacterium]|nr:protoporphyrinogen oxidase HemJ [Mariprofundales bacterium]
MLKTTGRRFTPALACATMYEWIKAFHVIAMVAWFAGLFYLPRLFVYHTKHLDDAVGAQFCIMERKLIRFIMGPAMVLTVVLGITMAVINWDYLQSQGWFHAKMAIVLLLIGFHLHSGRMVAQFANQSQNRSERFFRLYNEIPTIGLVLVVILVIVRPF